ncbi:acyltransferase family protein [Francisella sp. XLW-1]|uniref:acyltransferase family protein n=1 Tax=Francisella sp. XLW-1 TaxID=2610887 RepID=UPI00123CFA57|nr:acyltransferase family protein [Francisella sp. XLW-1]
MKYYKHIDGLRALAVLAVVLFHLNISWIKSGFLGVDIFFVISGFLITSIIIRDLENKTFSIKNFYLRRMRRILPALIVVLIFSTIFAWLILLPQDLRDYSKSLVSALGSFSNLYFFHSLSFGYFSTDSELIPLLHTWSLGIEEQFYIFWPLFLIAAFSIPVKLKNQVEMSIHHKLLYGCIILTILSLVSLIFLNGSAYYYFPVTRAFELLFGCFLAIYSVNKEITLSKLTANALGLISVVLMLVPILFVKVFYPGLGMIEACLGAALFIYVGLNNNTSFIHRIFSLKPLVAIGLISYSLYLWHWPIIAYVNYLSIDSTYLIKAIILIASFGLATLTYFLVEKPFRYKFKMPFSKTLIVLWIIPVLLASSFALCTRYIKNFAVNIPPPIVDLRKLNGIYGFERVDENKCFLQNSSPEFTSKMLPPESKCLIGDASQDKDTNILFIGDSHARAEFPMLGVWLSNIHKSAYLVSQRSTPFIENLPNTELGVSMIDRNNALKDLIRKQSFKYVVLGGDWSEKSNQPYISGIEESIKLIIKNHAVPVVILDTPKLPKGFNNYCIVSTAKFILLFDPHHCELPLEYVQKQQERFIKLIYKLKAKYPEMVLINPKKVLCNDSYCKTSLNGIPVYLDGHHLNYLGSQEIAKEYLKKYGNPLAPIIK